jgi:hypothetical protein
VRRRRREARTEAGAVLVTLSAASVDALASRIVETLKAAELRGPAIEFIDAAEVARRYDVSRAWVYENATRLGATPMSDGPRPRLRFDPDAVAEALSSCGATRGSAEPKVPVPAARSSPRRSSGMGTNARLLPIRGQEAAKPGREAEAGVESPPVERRA